MKFRRGNRVHHHAHGAGEIVDVNADYITIAFDDGMTRKFSAARVHLQASATPSPVHPLRPPRAKRARAKPRVELPPNRPVS
jgi:hypothetical protein